MEEELIGKKVKYKEHAKRSLVKSISWRVTGTVTVILVSYFFLNDFSFSLNIGLIDIISNIALYFLHERIWNLFDWGQDSIDHAFQDKTTRSITKTLTWRITASSYLVAIIYLLNGNLGVSIGIAIVDALLNLVEYYIHERIWNKVKWGQKSIQ